MVKTVQIRGVPDDVHRVLRSRAAAAGVSLSDYLLREISRVAARPPITDVLKRADERAGGASSEAILDVVQEMRDERERDLDHVVQRRPERSHGTA